MCPSEVRRFHAAVHTQHLACDPAGRRRRQKQRSVGNVFGGQRIGFAGWILDTDAQTLTPEDNPTADPLRLTTAEFRLLAALLERPRHVLTREFLLDAVSRRTAGAFDRSIDNLVSRLRRKIEADPANPAIVTTIRAGGYSLTADVRRL